MVAVAAWPGRFLGALNHRGVCPTIACFSAHVRLSTRYRQGQSRHARTRAGRRADRAGDDSPSGSGRERSCRQLRRCTDSADASEALCGQHAEEAVLCECMWHIGLLSDFGESPHVPYRSAPFAHKRHSVALSSSASECDAVLRRRSTRAHVHLTMEAWPDRSASMPST